MKEAQSSSNRIISCGLLFGIQLVSFMIRFAFAVVAPRLMELYGFSPKTMGYLLSAWNWSYTAGFSVTGLIVDRFGPYLVMGIGSLIWGVSTMTLTIATTAGSFFLMRMIFGLGQSTMIPAGALAISRGFRTQERARVIAIVFAGNQVGVAIGATAAAFILASLGWQAVFLCMGGASLLLTLGWFILYPEKQVDSQSASQPIQWLSMLRYRSTWGIAFGQMGYLYAYFFFIGWLPGYLILERKMTLLGSGIVSALPFWAGLLGTLGGGWIGDSLTQRGLSITSARKIIIGCGLVLSTVLMVATAYAGQSWVVVTFLTLCVGFLRLATGSVNSLPIDLSPPHMVGALTGIQNLFGSIGGLLAPIVTGYMVNATGSFAGSFVIAGCMSLFGAVSYLLIMDGNAISR
jgi:MFS transporter, ACS family, D-galactonate transporter